MEKDNNDKKVLPLYQEVRRGIYLNFQSLKRQNALVQTAQNNTELKASLSNFREKYLNFYLDSCTFFDKIKKGNDKKYLDAAYSKISVIKKKSIAAKITYICRIFIDTLGITDIVESGVRKIK